MKRTTSILVIAASVLLYGCSASPVPKTLESTGSTSIVPSGGGLAGNLAGNWQFSATSSSQGARPFSMAGAINQSTTIGGTIHIDRPDCFDPMISRSLAGPLTPDATSLVATGSDGQVVTLNGSFSDPEYDVIVGGNIYRAFAGTYKVDGGCAAGESGTVSGKFIDSIGIKSGAWEWSGTFTNGSEQQVFHGKGKIVQNNISDRAGSFSVGGDAAFDIECLSSGTMKAGKYPSGSFILGTSVALEFDTNSGVLHFAGTLDPDTNQISGSYTIFASSCNQSGSAVVQIPTGCPGCWDY